MANIEHCISCGRRNVPGTGRSCWVCYGAPEQDPEWLEQQQREQWEREMRETYEDRDG